MATLASATLDLSKILTPTPTHAGDPQTPPARAAQGYFSSHFDSGNAKQEA